METRLVSPKENILDANIDDLNEEELEVYLAALDQASDKTQSELTELDQAIAKTQSKKKELDERCENLSQGIEKRNQEIKVHKENIAVIDARMKKRDEELKEAIHETLKPLYTGEITHFDLSKVSDDPWFQETIRRGNQQKAPTSGSEQHTPPSPERHSVSSGASSTPPSKASHSDGHSRDSSSLSLSSRSDSDSGDEKHRSKDSPQLTKPALSSQAMVSVALPPSAAAPKVDVVKPAVAQLPKEDKTTRLPEKNSQQPVPVATSIAPAPQQKGLLAKLGFNKNKSAPQQQQLPVTATPGVVPVAIQQRTHR